MPATVPVKKIKSADRVLDIFELFSHSRPAVTVMDVARALNAPQSSTSELLGGLVRRGYLTRRRGERVFRPTSRVALLGAWVHPDLFRNGSLLQMIDSLHEQAGFGVALCSMVGTCLKHIHTVGPLPDELSSGAERHLLHSPFGHVILSTMFSRDVRLLVHRLNAESSADDQVRYGNLQARITEVSKKRSAMGDVAPGLSGIAVLLPQGMDEEQLAVGVIGPTAEIEARSEELLRTIRQAISMHVGPRVASTNEAIYPVLRQSGEKA